MYGTKAHARFQELVDGSFIESDNVEYIVDRDGCMVRLERSHPQVEAARKSLDSATNKIKA